MNNLAQQSRTVFGCSLAQWTQVQAGLVESLNSERSDISVIGSTLQDFVYNCICREGGDGELVVVEVLMISTGCGVLWQCQHHLTLLRYTCQ